MLPVPNAAIPLDVVISDVDVAPAEAGKRWRINSPVMGFRRKGQIWAELPSQELEGCTDVRNTALKCSGFDLNGFLGGSKPEFTGQHVPRDLRGSAELSPYQGSLAAV